jgi:hypothetical protein
MILPADKSSGVPLNSDPRLGGIGTLGEKSLHNALKKYIEPDTSWHEVKIGPYVADIVTGSGVTEIQTQSFANMRTKLGYMLGVCPVTVVYPAVHAKWLRWVDPVTGETTERRKSTKTGTFAEVLKELIHIRALLREPNLTIRVLLVDIEETRLKCGWSRDGKHGSRRIDRVPLAICGDLTLKSPQDYLALIPRSVPAGFTVADFRRAAHLGDRAAHTAVAVLTSVGAVRRTGKKGRSYIYERSSPECENKKENPEA